MQTVNWPRVWGVFGLLLFASSGAFAEDWPRFRGPNGAGLAPTSARTEWQATEIAWQTSLPGIGHSSPVVFAGRVFVTSGDEESGSRFVNAYRLSDGHRLWERKFAATGHRKHKLNSFASPTPAVDSERLYVAWATPEQSLITALDHDGQQLWQVDVGEFKSGHGFGVSPIVVDDMVVVALEHQGDSRWLALDSNTGEIRWQRPLKSSLHYATPCVRTIGDRRELIFTNWEQGISGVDPRTGEVNWAADVFDKQHIESSISSPVLAGDLVIGVCGWLGHQNEVAAVRPSAAGDGAAGDGAELVWKLERGAPLCVTPIVVGERLYLWTDTGIATCVDVNNGEVKWQRRVGGNYYASPIAIGDRLLNVSVDGEVVVLAAGDEYKVLWRGELDEGTHASPAVADGHLLLRTFGKLVVIGPK